MKLQTFSVLALITTVVAQCDTSAPVTAPTCLTSQAATTVAIVDSNDAVLDSITVQLTEPTEGTVTTQLFSTGGQDINAFWFNLRNITVEAPAVQLKCSDLQVTVTSNTQMFGGCGVQIVTGQIGGLDGDCTTIAPDNTAYYVGTSDNNCIAFDCSLVFVADANVPTASCPSICGVTFDLTVPLTKQVPADYNYTAMDLSVEYAPALSIEYFTGEFVAVTAITPELLGVGVASCVADTTAVVEYECYATADTFICDAPSAEYNFTFSYDTTTKYPSLSTASFYSNTLGSDVVITGKGTGVDFPYSASSNNGTLSINDTFVCPTPPPTPSPTPYPTLEPTVLTQAPTISETSVATSVAPTMAANVTNPPTVAPSSSNNTVTDAPSSAPSNGTRVRELTSRSLSDIAKVEGADCFSICQASKDFAWCAGEELTLEECEVQASQAACLLADSDVDVNNGKLTNEICQAVVSLWSILSQQDCYLVCDVPYPTEVPVTSGPTPASTNTTEVPVTPSPTLVITMSPTVAASTSNSTNTDAPSVSPTTLEPSSNGTLSTIPPTSL